MSRALPPRPDLERLRREARALQRATGQPLSQSQLSLARDYGFPSWPALKTEVEARRAAPSRSAAQLDAELLAAQWFALAEAGQLRALDRALAVGKGRKEAARTVMRRSRARYAAFQQALVAGLSAPRERVRFGCAAALDTFGDAGAREPLAALMDDPVPRVRWMAMHALSCHACGEKPAELEPPIRARMLAALANDPSPQVRRHAAFMLAAARETAAAPIIEAMLGGEPGPKLRRGLEWALSELRRPANPARAGL
ncbi:MAG TPA: HEAT repeat domain-containing protein [Caulobacteraceae bacterium]|nr:HEAT repeat domain-containing protein [Caulobacteraceae bacterium]